jgi:hypothetical protein
VGETLSQLEQVEEATPREPLPVSMTTSNV